MAKAVKSVDPHREMKWASKVGKFNRKIDSSRGVVKGKGTPQNAEFGMGNAEWKNLSTLGIIPHSEIRIPHSHFPP